MGQSARAVRRESAAQCAHQGYVEIEIFSESGANASDFSVCTGAHQLLRRGDDSDYVAAVRAVTTVLSDDLATGVAIHGRLSLVIGYDDGGEKVPQASEPFESLGYFGGPYYSR